MKKLAFLLILTLGFGFGLFMIPQPANAANVFSHTCDGYFNEQHQNTDVCQDVSQQNNSGKNPIIHIFKAAINIISFIIGLAALIGIVASGLRFVLSGGDTSAVAAARLGIIYSFVGIIVALLAQVLVRYVLAKA